jgi:FAD:protein FMN transferase
MAVAEPAPVASRFRAMGSNVELVVDGPAHLLETARLRIADLDRTWSRFISDSEISTLNRTSDWVRVSGNTMTLIDHAIVAWRMTGGAFDPTVLSSLVANGYANSRTDIAGHTSLLRPARRGPAPGPTGIEIDRDASRVRFGADVAFDPGGIGKGLAADLVGTELIAMGATAALVAIGGDVRVAGRASSGWVVAVEDPFDPNVTLIELSVLEGGVCTSSVRSKTWVDGGTPMHHLIDPRTGAPIASSIVSATVIVGEAWLAEVLCKAAIAAEPIDALDFLESAGVDGLLVDVDGLVWRTRNLERFAA